MKTLILKLTDDGFDAVVQLQEKFQLSEPQEVFVYALGLLQVAVDSKTNKDENQK